MKTRTWLLLFAALALVLAALAFRPKADGARAEVWSDGTLVMTLDLTRDGEYDVESAFSGGHNTVIVRDGQVFVSQADCPDGICVAHGPAQAGSPVVCLPNRLIVSLTGGEQEGADAAVG